MVDFLWNYSNIKFENFHEKSLKLTVIQTEKSEMVEEISPLN